MSSYHFQTYLKKYHIYIYRYIYITKSHWYCIKQLCFVSNPCNYNPKYPCNDSYFVKWTKKKLVLYGSFHCKTLVLLNKRSKTKHCLRNNTHICCAWIAMLPDSHASTASLSQFWIHSIVTPKSVGALEPSLGPNSTHPPFSTKAGTQVESSQSKP